MQPIIETKRLRLKELNAEIMNDLFNNHDDKHIISFLGLADNAALEVERGKWQKGLTTFKFSFNKFLIEEKETGKIIGHCGFHTWHILHHRAEIGYAITDDNLKGKGYMTEALRRVITFGFEEMGLNRQEAYVGPGNEPSQRLVKGAGFVEEGRHREHYLKNGEMQDSICFAILRPEWEAIKDSWAE